MIVSIKILNVAPENIEGTIVSGQANDFVAEIKSGIADFDPVPSEIYSVQLNSPFVGAFSFWTGKQIIDNPVLLINSGDKRKNINYIGFGLIGLGFYLYLKNKKK